MEFSAFTNVVLEHIFNRRKEDRGLVEAIIWSVAMETGEDLVNRVARVSIDKNGERCFFYVLAQTTVRALKEWKVVGRSITMHGALRMPDFENDMIWIE